MNLLQLVQASMGEMGLALPNAVASSTDPQIIQVYSLMNKVGNDIITNDEWQGLDTEYRFNTNIYAYTGDSTATSPVITGLSSTTGITAGLFMCTGLNVPADTYVQSVDSVSQVTLTNPISGSATGTLFNFSQTKYPLPADYDRQINRTQWDKGNHWELLGPKSPQEWQYMKSGIVSTGPRMRYRILGGYFQLWPPALVSTQIGFEYTSNAWVTALDGTKKAAFSNDADTCIFRDRTMICGSKFEFFSIKGFDTTTLSRDYEIQKGKEMALDHGAPTLSLQSSGPPLFISPGSIPESGFGR